VSSTGSGYLQRRRATPTSLVTEDALNLIHTTARG
jgi:hypothetical protein